MTTPAADPGSLAPDDDNPKRRQILDGARQMFLAHGFEGASMQDVARAAGVSKGTLYVYFDNKEAMFEALVKTECAQVQRTITALAAGTAPVEQELTNIGCQILHTLLQPQLLAAMRMMIGAGEKFPALARHLYASGPMRSRAIMAAYLERRARQGDLDIPNPEEAGAEFLDLVVAGLQRRALLMMPPMPHADIHDFVQRRVRRFVAAYRPQP